MSNQNIILFENGFFPNKCPLCGRNNLEIDFDDLASEVAKQFHAELEPINQSFDDLATRLKELKNWQDELEQKTQDEFETGWVYTKVWQEKSWMCVKIGRTRDIKKREKQYDDHDYILNLYAPVCVKLLSSYEQYLSNILFNFLIPSLLNYRNRRLEIKLGEDFKHIQIRDGFAPERKEYYRLFINEEDIEFDFLFIGLTTLFGGIVGPNYPINHNEWINHIEKFKANESQKNIFDELENDKE